jgi:protein SFI1
MGQARDCHILRLALHTWRTLLASRLELRQRVSHFSDERRLKVAFNIWVHKLHDKRRISQQHAMRAKMKIIREKRESKLRKDAWAKWRQSYQSHLSRQHYAERLILRLYQRWKHRLYSLDHMDTAADIHLSGIERKNLEKTWSYWRRELEIKMMERTISESVCVKVMKEAMKVWMRRL